MNLDNIKNLLQNVELEAIPEGKKGGASVDKKPVVGDIKIAKNGRIYFSDEFKAKLIAPDKDADGNDIYLKGIDFIDSRNWGMFNAEQDLVFVCFPELEDSKLCSRVDVRKESINSPMTAVKEQLIPMLIELYGLDEDFAWIELSIVWDTAITHPSGVYSIPKIGSKGADKGKITHKRRENVSFFPLILIETAVEAEEGASEETSSDEETITVTED